MKHRASLTLMELLVIVLVFALCAALCLRVFVAADGISQENHLRDEATLLAQNTAEALKAGIPLPAVPKGLSRAVTPVPSGISGLSKAEISVCTETGEPLIAFTLSWQEVGQ